MKKVIAIILVAIMSLSVFATGSFAADAATSVNPEKINGEAYTATPFLTFDGEYVGTALIPHTGSSNKMTMEIVDGVGIKGAALKTEAIGNAWAQGEITFNEADFSLYDGLLFYTDLSGLTMSPDSVAKGQANGVSMRLTSNYVTGSSWTRNTEDPKVENFAINVYYLENGEWKLCDQAAMNGERFMLPAQFKGWVYVPFASYITRKGPDGVPVAGIYGDIGMGKMMILTGCYQKLDSGNVMIFDEIQLVKLGAAPETQAPETQAPETQAPETQAPETQAPETQAPETKAPETNSPETQAPDTNATDTEAPKSGCGSAIGTSIAFVAVAVLGIAVVSKKRR